VIQSSADFRSSAGGIVGYFYDGVSTISTCYSTGKVSSSVNFSGPHSFAYAGGITGNGGKISNCAALNPSLNLTCTDGFPYFGRVVGMTEDGNLSNNIAFDKMINPSGGISWSNKGLNKIDGDDITADQINADGTLGNRFTSAIGTLSNLFRSADGWTTANGKLPGLFGNTVEIPAHISNAFTGIEMKENVSPDIKVYPNPVSDVFFIESENFVTVKLFDMLGREILTKSVKGKTEINVNNLSKGIYNIIVYSGGKVSGSQKIVKR
jgi:hypothetical protein